MELFPRPCRRKRARRRSAGLFACCLALLLAGGLLAGCSWTVQPAAERPFQEPLVPTALAPSHAAVAGATPAAPLDTDDPQPPAEPPPFAQPGTLRWRAGVGVPDGQSPLIYAWSEPRPGWYLNWSVGFTETVWITGTLGAQPAFHIPPDETAGMEFAPMVRTPQGRLVPPAEWIAAAARARPGHTWLIGNEPDVRWQDGATPEAYASAYHTAYTTIMQADPTAQVGFAGLSQITPLRLAYLERVWEFYSETYGVEMPVDVWNMHAFVLQEKAGDWGVDVPPGFEHVAAGESWTIEEHDDLALVEEQVRRMRAWMAAHGQRAKPLWVSEYGILMPADYGFDEPRVRAFLFGSYDLFNSLRDPALGYAADDDRLVQRWVWFSAGYDLYPTGDLFTRDGRPTGLMHALSAYLAEFGP